MSSAWQGRPIYTQSILMITPAVKNTLHITYLDQTFLFFQPQPLIGKQGPIRSLLLLVS